MSSSAPYLSPSEAAKRLGISAKALRLYEQRGLLTPARTTAGWRAYGPREMACAREIASLRALGLGLRQIAQVLAGDSGGLEPALAAHQATLEARVRQLSQAIAGVRGLRSKLARGGAPSAAEHLRADAPVVAFDLPWPWGGERFEVHDIRPLNYIIGPLGSGKTRLAKRLAEVLPGAAFLGLDRLADGGAAARLALAKDAALEARVDRSLAWLAEDGATVSQALRVLLAALESEGAAFLVIDMLEHRLDKATQEALIGHLRRHASQSRPLFMLTRSSAILDLQAMGADEAIILCPANHSPPTAVAPHPGAPGYEAVASCLASPEVRARTEGVIAAWRSQAAGA